MPEEKPVLILYHANCPDGFCAAWVASKVFPDAEFIPVLYGQHPPDVTGRDVYILDFCYKRDVLFPMIAKASSLLVIDHHKTALEDVGDSPHCYFSVTKSGARLTHELLCMTRGAANPFPLGHWLIDYTEDRDLWRWELPQSREISAVIASYPRTFEAWNKLASMMPPEFFREGEAILRYKQQLIDQAVGSATEMTLSGHKILAANVGAVNLVSEVAGELAKGRPFGACWYDVKGMRTWSLRSTAEGVDVSEIAKQFGGGGHRNAAGFQYPVDSHSESTLALQIGARI